MDFCQPQALVSKRAPLAIYYDPLRTGGDSAFNLCDNIPVPTNLNNSASNNSTRCHRTFYESKYIAPTVSNHLFFLKSYWEKTINKECLT